MRKKFDTLASVIANIDVGTAEAYKPEDRDMILTAVKTEFGVSELNSIVKSMLRYFGSQEHSNFCFETL